MFVKMFAQILDSSIADDHLVRWVFEDLLKLADRDGVVDMTLCAIARRTNVPIETVTRGITHLLQPDPTSRSLEEEGRRIVPIDSKRPWGWRIVNYRHYRDIRDNEDRKAYFREQKREQRSKAKKLQESARKSETVSDCPGQSVSVTQAEADAEAVSDADASSPRRYERRGPAGPKPEDLIYEEYPRKEGRRAAIKAICKAAQRLRTGEGMLAPMKYAEALDYLLRRTQTYATSPAGSRTDRNLIPHPSTWYSESRYLDEEANWGITGKDSGNEITRGNRGPAAGRTNRALGAWDRAAAKRRRVRSLDDTVQTDASALPPSRIRN